MIHYSKNAQTVTHISLNIKHRALKGPKLKHPFPVLSHINYSTEVVLEDKNKISYPFFIFTDQFLLDKLLNQVRFGEN